MGVWRNKRVMKIISKQSTLLCSNFYILCEQEKAILIDPAILYIDKIFQKIDYILLTHEHYDHISGVNYWKNKYPAAKVICSSECSRMIISPNKNLSKHFDAFCQFQTWIKSQENIDPVSYSCKADVTFSKYDVLWWKDHKIEMYYAPGHSIGSSIYVVDETIMFSGDSMFRNYPTFTSLYKNGKYDFSNITLPLIRSMNKNIQVYPGHFEPFPINDAYFIRSD